MSPKKPSLVIEHYSDRYFLDVVRVVENFHKEAVCEFDDLFDANSLIETIKAQDPNNAFLLIVDGSCQGLLFGTAFKSLINGRLLFQEIIWYINEPFRQYGVRLLREAQGILKSRGVSLLIMAALENSKTAKLKRFYEVMGFKPMETHFVKTL